MSFDVIYLRESILLVQSGKSKKLIKKSIRAVTSDLVIP